MAIRQLSRYQTFDEPMDDFGSDDVFLQNVIAPPPVAAPAPAPAPIAAPAPAPYVAPQAFQPRTSLMPEPMYEDFGVDDSFLRSVVAPTPAPPPAWQPLAQQISSQWQQYGINPDIKGINRANELAQILTNYGITDLSKIGLTEATPYQEEFYYPGSDIADPSTDVRNYTRRQITYGDKTLGKLGGFGSKGQQEFADPLEYLAPAHEGSDRYGLAYSAAGKGWVDYEVVPGPGGKPVIVPRWGSTSDITPELLSVLAFAAAPFTGGLSTALAPVAGAAAPILSQALVSGTLSGLGAEAQGGSFGKGFGKGAIAGGAGAFATPYIGQLGSAASNVVGGGNLGDIVSGAVTGAGRSALGATISGQSISDALLSGAAGGAASAGTNLLIKGTNDTLGQYLKDVPPPIRNAVLSAAGAGILGKDPGKAAINTFIGDLMKEARGKSPSGKAASAGYGGADAGDFFDSEEAQAVQDDIDSILARYPEAAPAPYFPEFEAPLLTAAPAPAPAPTFKPPSDEDYEEIESLLLRYPEQQVPDVAPKTAMPPQEMAKFLEANIDDPGTIETLMQDYFPELYRQQIEVPGTRLPPTVEPIYEQPPTPAPEPIYEQPPTPAPTPTAPPAAAPAAPAPAPAAPAPAPKKQDDLALLMMLAAMMTPQQKEEEQYQLAQILGVDSPFGRIV